MTLRCVLEVGVHGLITMPTQRASVYGWLSRALCTDAKVQRENSCCVYGLHHTEETVQVALDVSNKQGLNVKPVASTGDLTVLSALMSTSYQNMAEGSGPMGYIPKDIVLKKLLPKSDLLHLTERSAATNYFLVYSGETFLGSIGLDRLPGHSPPTYAHKVALGLAGLYRTQQLAVNPKLLGSGVGRLLQYCALDLASGLNRPTYLLAPLPKGDRLSQFWRVPGLDYFISSPVETPQGYPSIAEWNKQWFQRKDLQVLPLKRDPEAILMRERSQLMEEAKLDRGFHIAPGRASDVLQRVLNMFPDPDQAVPYYFKLQTHFAPGGTKKALDEAIEKKLNGFRKVVKEISENPEFASKVVCPPQSVCSTSGNQVPLLLATMNPPHQGHIESLIDAIDQLNAPYGMMILVTNHPTKTQENLDERLLMAELFQKKYPQVGIVICNHGGWRDIFKNINLLLPTEDRGRLSPVNVIGSDKVKSCLSARSQDDTFLQIPHLIYTRSDDSDVTIQEHAKGLLWVEQDRIIPITHHRRWVSSSAIRGAGLQHECPEGTFKLLHALIYYLEQRRTTA